MFKLTVTLAVALYAGFVIWGDPTDSVAEADTALAPATVSTRSAEPASPVILREADAPGGAVVARPAVTDLVVPEAAVIAAAAPDPAGSYVTPRPIGEPVLVSLRAAAAPDAGAPDAGASDRMVVTGSRVNMREGPSTRNAVVDSLTRGTVVERIGVAESGWIELRDVATGRTGFMSPRFLDPA